MLFLAPNPHLDTCPKTPFAAGLTIIGPHTCCQKSSHCFALQPVLQILENKDFKLDLNNLMDYAVNSDNMIWISQIC